MLRHSTFVTISRDMQYTGINTLIKYLKKKNLKLVRYLILRYLNSRFHDFETFRGYKILRKWSKVAKSAKSNTFKVIRRNTYNPT